jgi:ParB family chromosome partitioning protein
MILGLRPDSPRRIRLDCALPNHPSLGHSDPMVKPALGRGLGALLGAGPAIAKTALPSAAPEMAAAPALPAKEGLRVIDLKQIHPCPFQPRKEFSEESIRELADSIKEQGLVQPLVVREVGSGFELIAGERRWRAAQLLGLPNVPVLVRVADDRTVLELALVENLQRENLNPLEEALGFAQLIEQFRLTQEEAAARVGKSRAAVANALRLLKLPGLLQEKIRKGILSVGHAKVILGLADPIEQTRAAEKVTAGSLNVRQTEELINGWQQQNATTSALQPSTAPSQVNRDTHVADLEHRLTERLGTKVILRYRDGKGSIEARFFSEAELDRLLQIIGVPMD